MRVDFKVLILALAVASWPALSAAQSAADGPVLGATHLNAAGAGVKIFNSAGVVRVVGWDLDSVLVRGHIPRSEHFVFTRATDTSNAVMLGRIDFSGPSANEPASFVVYMPKHASVAVKASLADIDAHDVSGWFYSVSGSIRVSGAARTAELESVSGNIDLAVSTAWARARTGSGHLLVRGAPQDVDVSTVSGILDIATSSIMRGQFTSVAGDIRYDGSPAAGAIFDFSNHSGAVDLVLPADASGVFQLTSITGPIENGLSSVRPVRSEPHQLRVVLGRGAAGAQVDVRTFKGAVRLRPR